MYLNGDGVRKNYKTAAKYYNLAASQNFSDAQRELGLLYKEGNGVPKDEQKAYMWLNLAASHGDDQARKALLDSMTNNQVATAQRMTRTWKPKTNFPVSR